MNKSKPGDDRVDTSKECTDKEAGGTESAKQETSCPQFIVLQASKCEDIVLPGNETHGSYKVQIPVSSALYCSLPSQGVSF